MNYRDEYNEVLRNNNKLRNELQYGCALFKEILLTTLHYDKTPDEKKTLKNINPIMTYNYYMYIYIINNCNEILTNGEIEMLNNGFNSYGYATGFTDICLKNDGGI